ncbi:serpin B6-like [Cydia amplana]|uniref:serpin B6-like n=1 Tax=Cydia amplana TaxID=1869771 RepID=UPI002FE54745
MATYLYLLAIFLPSILGQCTVEKASPSFSRAVYEFSLDLIQRVGQENDNHFVTSPFSLWTVLTSASLGADDETLAEMKRVLRLHHYPCFNDRYLEIVKGITVSNTKTTLERSSALFVDKTVSLLESFHRKLSGTGVCDVMILPFDNYNNVAATINNYVSQATHNTIEEIVSSNDIEGVYLLLLDAVYFKGMWNIPFEPSETEITAFYDEKNSPAGDVNMMFSMRQYNLASIDQLQAKVLELPYGDGDRFSMLIFLPDQSSSVAKVTDQLKRVTLKSIFYIFQRNGLDTVQVQIPRFKITSQLDNLKELLMDMGLKLMFDSSAQFPYISDYSFYISNVVQKADVEVTEEGTVAAAASAAEFEARRLPDSFQANRPFLFMIVDKLNYIPLFTGAYSKPSVVLAELPETYTLSEEEKSYLAKHGFLVIKGLIDFTTLYSCKQQFSKICKGLQDPGNILVVKEPSLVNTGAKGEDLINKLQEIHHDEVFINYTEHPRLLHVVSQLIGADMSVMHSMLINKPPGTSRHPPHQDLFYFPFRPVEWIMAAWTAIDDVTVENGCLYVVPGSHLENKLHDHGTVPNSNRLYHGILDEAGTAPEQKRVCLEMSPGDTVFFHPLLVHGSGPNVSKRYRKAITAHYANSGCHFHNEKGELARQIEAEAKKKGYTLSYTDVWKFKSKQITLKSRL